MDLPKFTSIGIDFARIVFNSIIACFLRALNKFFLAKLMDYFMYIASYE